MLFIDFIVRNTGAIGSYAVDRGYDCTDSTVVM